MTQSSEAPVSLPLEYLLSEYEPGWKQEHSFKKYCTKIQQQKNDSGSQTIYLSTNSKQNLHIEGFSSKSNHLIITSVGCTLKFQRLRGYDNNRGWQNIRTDSETNIHYISSIIAYNDQA